MCSRKSELAAGHGVLHYVGLITIMQKLPTPLTSMSQSSSKPLSKPSAKPNSSPGNKQKSPLQQPSLSAVKSE